MLFVIKRSLWVGIIPKRQVGNKMFGGDSSHLPLKLNTAGVIPPIFASSLLLLPITVQIILLLALIDSWYDFRGKLDKMV